MRTDEHLYDELKRLKKDLARVTQERDLLKKLPRTLRKSPNKVRMDKRASR